MEGYKYWGYTNEELIPLARAGDEDAYKQLFYNLRPIIIHVAMWGCHRIPIFDMDDYFQEGHILIWELCVKWKVDSGNFAGYFNIAIRHRFNNLFFQYYRKSPIVIWEKEGADHNIAYLGQHYYVKKCLERIKKYNRLYKQEHKDQINEYKKKAWWDHHEENLEKGRRNYAECKVRIQAKNKRYREKHKDELLAKHRKYYAEHKEEIKARRKERDALRRDAINARQRAYWAAHRDHLNALRSESDAKRKDEVNARQRAYRLEHRDKLNARRKQLNAQRRDEINARQRENAAKRKAKAKQSAAQTQEAVIKEPGA